MALQHLRSGTANKRPIPTVMSAGQLAINTNEGSPGLFFKDSNGDLVKVGPVHIGTSAPNSTPDSLAATALVTGTVYQILTVGNSDFTLVGASANTVGTVFTATGTTTGTGTVSGQQGNEKGEQWLDTTGSAFDLKIYDGNAWRSQAGEFVNVTGDTMTGAFGVVAGTASAPGVFFSGDTNTGLLSPGGDSVAVTTGGTQRVVVDSSGNVGIGTTSPKRHLHLNGGSEAVKIQITNATTGSSNDGEGFQIGIGTDGTANIEQRESADLAFYTNNTEAMRIDSSRRLMVGATSNASSAAVQGFKTHGSTGNESGFTSIDTTAMAAGVGGEISFMGNTTTAGEYNYVGHIRGIKENATSGNTACALTFHTRPTATAPTERLRIDSSGITNIMRIQNYTTSFDPWLKGVNSSGTETFYVKKDGSASFAGRVGIGTSSPDSYSTFGNKLVVYGTGTNGPGMTIATGSSDTGSLYFADGTSGNEAFRGSVAYSHGDDALLFSTAASEHLRIDSSGDVQIGTTAPFGGNVANRGHLTLNGTNDFKVQWGTGGTERGYLYADATNLSIINTQNGYLRLNTNNQERMRIDSSGNVGIGTTPSNHLGLGYVLRLNGGSQTYIAFNNSTVPTQVTGGLVIGNDSNSAWIVQRENQPIKFSTNNQERMQIDSSGRLLINNTAGVGSYPLQVTAASDAHAICIRGRSSDDIGELRWLENDGVTALGEIQYRQNYVNFRHRVGEIRFATGGTTERMRIDGSGFTKIVGDTGGIQSSTLRHELRTAQAGQIGIYNEATSTSYANSFHYINVARAASSLYSFYHASSNNNGDTEFRLRGDGNAYADGSWNGGGADYAEYFEWSDGNTEAEDRRGISVVLNGNKIREAVADEEPIGVISGNPSVVGDADIDRWKGKYLRDDFGTYIQEDYEIEDANSNTVVQQRRKLNPDYNPDTEYVSREDRPEWDCVGLMGKLRIRKGQVTGSRWIKMRDISDSVEEWLVR